MFLKKVKREPCGVPRQKPFFLISQVPGQGECRLHSLFWWSLLARLLVLTLSLLQRHNTAPGSSPSAMIPDYELAVTNEPVIIIIW